MKSILTLFILLFSLSSLASVMTCESPEGVVTLHYGNTSEIRVVFKGESAFADGIVTKDEVDLVVRLPSSGEMTIYARVGKREPGNYLFFRGKRNPVFCR